MVPLISSVLESTVGLLFGIARDNVANKLKEGDPTSVMMHKIIVRPLSDIKANIDCLSLKDLGSSYSFLKEGIVLLFCAIDNVNEELSEGISNDSDVSGILTTACLISLPQATQRLKISSEKRFISAQDRFKDARGAATHAFNNKSLCTKDRIMACKLRVAATILESGLEDPEAATKACLESLKELHALPAIQDTFSVFLNGGLRSWLNKSERLENIMSVLSINHVLFAFAAKYSSQYLNVNTWPGIVLKDRTFNPILNTPEILAKTSTNEQLFQQLNEAFDNSMSCCECPWVSAAFPGATPGNGTGFV